MDVGTADIIDVADDEPKRLRTGSVGGSRPGNGGSKPPGGGGDGPGGGDAKRDEAAPFVTNKSRILTSFILLVVMMTFGGLIAAYVVIATNNVAEWKPFNLPPPVWISTALILLSSLTYHAAKVATDREKQPAAKKWLIATTVLGASFISSQMIAWLVLTSRGFYMSGNPYAGFFYILTAVHAIHVIGGISALGAILLRSWNPIVNPAENAMRKTLAQVVGWYWHFMGGLWLVLFVLLGFWK